MDAYYYRGISQGTLKRYFQAIDDFTKVLELLPDEPKYRTSKFTVFLVRGLTKNNLGDKTGAIKDLSKAIQINPQNSTAYFSRGMSKTSLGYFDDAIADYTKSIKLNPKNPNPYLFRADAKYKLGKKDASCSIYGIRNI